MSSQSPKVKTRTQWKSYALLALTSGKQACIKALTEPTFLSMAKQKEGTIFFDLFEISLYTILFNHVFVMIRVQSTVAEMDMEQNIRQGPVTL